jgi:DNA-binding ferritin-like protein
MHQNTNYYVAYIAFIRAAYHWFHAAHHVTSGTGFHGDHELYAEIYGDYVEILDGAIEKSIGTCGVEVAAAPLPSLAMAINFLQRYPSPETLTSLAIASTALQVEKDYLGVVDELFTALESAGALPLGLNDFLAASANKHDVFVYKLTQRVKTEVQD